MDSRTPSILIVGTGAMACLFAARLSAAGASVTMFGSWRDGLDALRKSGVRVVENGVESRATVRAVDDPADCAGASVALVLVKSWQTRRVAKLLARCLSPDGLVVTLQNGLGNDEILAATLGNERVSAGVTTAGAWMVEPGRVHIAGHGTVTLSETHGGIRSLRNLLRDAGFDVEMVADLSSIQWGKLVINAAINPLSALLRVPNGDLLDRPAARALQVEIAREAAAVASAIGVRLPYDDAVAAIEETMRGTAGNFSSMHQDLRRGAPTEIDQICGAIVRAGERAGIPTPVNRSLLQLVIAATEGRES